MIFEEESFWRQYKSCLLLIFIFVNVFLLYNQKYNDKFCSLIYILGVSYEKLR